MPGPTPKPNRPQTLPTDESCRGQHPARSTKSSRCPECSSTFRAEEGSQRVCPRCGVVLLATDGGVHVDRDATRAALFAAADACAGRWTLREMLVGDDITEPELVRAYDRLALAESGVLALGRLPE